MPNAINPATLTTKVVLTAVTRTAGAVASLLEQEARGLLTRLTQVKPFALQETMVVAAAVSPTAQAAIDRYLIAGRRAVHRQIIAFLQWLRSPAGQASSAAEAQQRFTMLRLRFNAALTQLDIFADAFTQRSEHENGVWLAGLDVVATDALTLRGNFYAVPPVICYLDRGHGAAIRRARTRLPGGGESPAAVIRVPRERMVGSGIASSLIHEVGHQGAALLDLIESLRPVLQGLQRNESGERPAWQYWERCLSEIVADFWSVARLGITSTLGLMAVVALPRYFVFRLSLDDPHPMPWLRLKLSCTIGNALFPHPQWQQLATLWEGLYPPLALEPEKRALLTLLERTMPGFAALLAHHRPKSLRGASLAEALGVGTRQPAHLQALFTAWQHNPAQMHRAPPVLVFAVLGQARAERRLSPETESRWLSKMLTTWALRNALQTSAHCAPPSALIPSRGLLTQRATHQEGA